MDEKQKIVTDRAVVIENNKIVDVGPTKKIESAYSTDEIVQVKDGAR